MKNTKLIMIEGIPGLGKSTTAQFLSHLLHREGHGHKWWYEEELGHPVYVYDDVESMQNIIDDLHNGNYRSVIERALKKWRKFAASVQSSTEIIVVDSCLFGYLTWSLFPISVPRQEILTYVKDVERIIKPLNPNLIYFYQTDIGGALNKICTRRGGDTEKNFIQAATQSPYGISRGLEGFEGMVAYWEDYRRMTDEAFQSMTCPKIAIDNSEGNWPAYKLKLSEFLGIEPSDENPTNEQDLEHYVGTFLAEREGGMDCTFQIESGNLIADGLPQVWPRTRLIPLSANVFAVQSLPFQVRFTEDDCTRVELTGPALLSGPVHYTFTKRELPAER